MSARVAGITFTKKATGYAITCKMVDEEKRVTVSYTATGLSMKPDEIRRVRDEAVGKATDALDALTAPEDGE